MLSCWFRRHERFPSVAGRKRVSNTALSEGKQGTRAFIFIEEANMKNLIRKSVLSSLALSGILASAVSYAGTHTLGFVTITTTSTSKTLSATMNVRYNDSYPNSYAYMSGYINDTISILEPISKLL